ncbi:MAG: tRNA uridine-5-carboxymethylaminomethyl(34) synthesis GTPase MnmE [Maricaulaceae bacterium]|jgi:tRNA modification GTPase
MSEPRSTIFALASGAGRAGVAVFRVSGPDAGKVLDKLAGERPEPRRATLKSLHAPGSNEAFDQGLVLWFPGPDSFTGEDVAELHLHGGRAVAAAATTALLTAGATPAGPGEFTRRAFENGKFDLTQAEAIADLVEAETEAQRAQAARQLEGELGRICDRWRSALIDIIAQVEADIDFPDEGDVAAAAGDGLADRTAAALASLEADMTASLDDNHRGERVREGLRVAIIGAPNVGKSAFLNRLVAREAAIVHHVPGTTRDVVEAHLSLGGQLVNVSDTAGLRQTSDPIEAEGVRRARARAQEADLRIAVADATRPDTALAFIDLLQDGDVVWVNKTDLASAITTASTIQSRLEALHVERQADVRAGSAKSGAGFDALVALLAGRVAVDPGPVEAAPLTRARHREALTRARDALRRARPKLATSAELAGEDLRLAARALGEITGRVDVEDVLDRVFASFCIGK